MRRICTVPVAAVFFALVLVIAAVVLLRAHHGGASTPACRCRRSKQDLLKVNNSCLDKIYIAFVSVSISLLILSGGRRASDPKTASKSLTIPPLPQRTDLRMPHLVNSSLAPHPRLKQTSCYWPSEIITRMRAFLFLLLFPIQQELAFDGFILILSHECAQAVLSCVMRVLASPSTRDQLEPTSKQPVRINQSP